MQNISRGPFLVVYINENFSSFCVYISLNKLMQMFHSSMNKGSTGLGPF